MTTWDWISGVRFIPTLDKLVGYNYGFDLYRTLDGVHWEAPTRTGMLDGVNTGGRTLLSTEAGLFLGTARPKGGGEMFLCDAPSCADAAADTSPLPAPKLLQAESEAATGRNNVLTWEPTPGAVRYRIYRSTVVSLSAILPGALEEFEVPGFGKVSIEDVRNGVLDSLCTPATEIVCRVLDAIKTSPLPDVWIGIPSQFLQVGLRLNPTFSEPSPTEFQALYFVRAEDAIGNLSPPSNFVGAPSKAGTLPADRSVASINPVLSHTANGAGWHNQPVTVTWNVEDHDSSVGKPLGCEPTTVEADTPGITIACHAVNGRGMTGSGYVTVRVDRTAPQVAFGEPTPGNAAGWLNQDALIDFVVSDDLSGEAPGGTTSPLAIRQEGRGVTGIVSVSDIAGNVADVGSPAVNIDKTPPSIAGARAPAPNPAGWSNTDVVVTFTCVDALSGLATCGSQEQIVTTEGARQFREAEATDMAGNRVSAVVAGINIDKTAPLIEATRDVPPNEHGWVNADVTVMFSAADNLSGIATISAPVTVTSEGANQPTTGAAVDFAGNQGVVTASISIDKTPPEASLRFDANMRDVAVFGRDSLSGVVSTAALSPSAVRRAFWGRRDEDDGEEDEREERRSYDRTQQRTYQVFDLAGNSPLAPRRRQKPRQPGEGGGADRAGPGSGPSAARPAQSPEVRVGAGKEVHCPDLAAPEPEHRRRTFALLGGSNFRCGEEPDAGVWTRPKPRQRTIFPGFVPLRLETSHGAASVQFEPES